MLQRPLLVDRQVALRVHDALDEYGLPGGLALSSRAPWGGRRWQVDESERPPREKEPRPAEFLLSSC
jgi:hypothetical protein